MEIQELFTDFVLKDENENLAIELQPVCKSLMRSVVKVARYPNGWSSYFADDEKVRDFKQWENPIWDKFFEYILDNVNEYVKHIKVGDYTKPVLTDCWVSVMDEYGGHETHQHGQSDISGNFYVDATMHAAPIHFQRPYMQLSPWAYKSHTRANKFLAQETELKTRTGILYLWNSTMRHGVRNNHYKGRTAISFNVDLKC